MKYTIEEMINMKGRTAVQTDYINSDILNFTLFSSNCYTWNANKLKFKESLTVMDFKQVREIFEPFILLKGDKYITKFPYFTDNLEVMNKLWKQGERIAVEGGPCLFSKHEADVIVKTESNEYIFDFVTGKSYLSDTEEMTLKQCLMTDNVKEIYFINHKQALSIQEYLQLEYPFKLASILKGPLVIPLPDMSYRKYLQSLLINLSENKYKETLLKFDNILDDIVKIYLSKIEELQNRYKIEKFECIYRDKKDVVNKWYSKRNQYIDKVKFLKSLTKYPEKLESIKDYVTMPALPYYLFDSKYIIEINSMDETDSYRKCKKQHKKDIIFGCILFPELMSKNNNDTEYNAPVNEKEYIQ